MMRNSKKNSKAGLFFVLLVLVGYFFIHFGQKASSDNEKETKLEAEIVTKPEECTTCGQTVEEEILYDESEVSVVMVDEKYTVDVTGQVAGIGDVLEGALNLGSCNSYNSAQLLDSTMRLCPKSSTDIELKESPGIISSIFGSTVNVEAISDIELTLVTYPLALFLGQYVMQSSTREATMESPNYPSSGQVIDENYTLKTHTPQMSKELKEKLGETVREDYEVTASVEIDGVDRVDQDVDGKYPVVNADHNPKSACTEEGVSSSDYNPGSPNRQGSIGGGYSRQQIPGGDPLESMETNQCLRLDSDYKRLNVGILPSCVSVLGLTGGFFEGLLSKTFSKSQWEGCNGQAEPDCYFDQELGREVCIAPSTSKCIDTRDIGVKITPIYGDPYKCEDELCANAYLTNSYKAGLTPIQSSEKKIASGNSEESLMFFIGTPCRAKIKAGSFSRDVNITCLWDVSPLLLDYKLQAMYKTPGQEGFPTTFEMYWALVEKAMELSAEFYEL